MKNKKKYINEEIDLTALIIKFWKDKYLILGIVLLCILFSYLLSINNKKNILEFKTKLTIKLAPDHFFVPFEVYRAGAFKEFFDKKKNPSLNKRFNTFFKSEILSSDNIKSFVKKNNQIDNFKNYLNKNNLSVHEFFLFNFGESGKNQYELIFPQSLEGDVFLNDYIQYVKYKSLKIFLNDLKITIINIIEILEHNLRIAEKIDIVYPVENKKNDLYYKGSIVLSEEILNFKKLLFSLENHDFDFNHILVSASDPSFSNKILINKAFPILGFFIGLFLSFMIIYIKNILKNSSFRKL